MAFCTQCGANVAAGTVFCTKCGAPLNSNSQTPSKEADKAPKETPAPAAPPIDNPTPPSPPPYQNTVNRQQAYNTPLDPPPLSTSKYALVPTSNFFWTMLLMAIPLVNLIMVIVWTCGGTKYENKRNYAKAALIWMLISIGLILIITILILSVLPYFLVMFRDFFNGFENYFDLFKYSF